MEQAVAGDSSGGSGLVAHAPGLWTVAAPQRFLGLHLGTRMTVVRLASGALWLHSPVPLTPALASALDALGPVGHIVCPNLYHHLHAGPYAERYREARVHAPAGLRRKRKDLRIDADLAPSASGAPWEGQLDQLRIEGSLLRETVFHHPASRSLISVDLIENFATSPHGPTRLYLELGGIHGKPGWSRLGRWLYRDRPAARASFDRLAAWDFDRILLAHGDIIERDGPRLIREGMAWLGLRTP
jgi:uncharacterized protein DUF4336